jgi:A/G-specific adenine glycosylase
MWEVPHAPRTGDEKLSAAAIRVARELTGLEVEAGEELLTISHSVTRYRITMACVEAIVNSGRFRPGFYAAGEWLLPSELGKHPVSSPQRKLIREIVSRGKG